MLYICKKRKDAFQNERSYFPLVLSCHLALLLPQDAATSIGVKNIYIAPVQLEPNFIFIWGMKSTQTVPEGLTEKKQTKKQ